MERARAGAKKKGERARGAKERARAKKAPDLRARASSTGPRIYLLSAIAALWNLVALSSRRGRQRRTVAKVSQKCFRESS